MLHHMDLFFCIAVLGAGVQLQIFKHFVSSNCMCSFWNVSFHQYLSLVIRSLLGHPLELETVMEWTLATFLVKNKETYSVLSQLVGYANGTKGNNRGTSIMPWNRPLLTRSVCSSPHALLIIKSKLSATIPK